MHRTMMILFVLIAVDEKIALSRLTNANLFLLKWFVRCSPWLDETRYLAYLSYAIFSSL